MASSTYLARRGQLEVYFDRTAADTWAKLTSDAPVSRIRATVRAGRDRMRDQLLSWLPQDLRGCRVLDAGCGTGALAVAIAQRGASVVAVDLSPSLIRYARERKPADLGPGHVEFHVGDMLDANLRGFDYAVAMDSLIHYRAPDMLDAVASLAARSKRGVLFTFAPRTPLLAVMHAVGRTFPRRDRAPMIEPVSEQHLRNCIDLDRRFDAWRVDRTQRVDAAFYKSQALELRRL